MQLKDFYTHVRICLTKEIAEKEFSAMLAGAKPGGVKEPKGKFDKSKLPNKEQQKGTVRGQQTEKALSFEGKVRKVRIN